MQIIQFLAVGLVAGMASGFFGIGGAVIIVPSLIFIMGFSQTLAQGTSLVMFLLAPSFLAAIQYYRSGNADIKAAGLLWIGVFIGSAISAWVVNTVFKDSSIFIYYLKKSFAIVLLLIAIQTWIKA